MKDSLAVIVWLVATVGGTAYFKTNNPDLAIAETAIAIAFVAALVVGALMPSKRKSKSA